MLERRIGSEIYSNVQPRSNIVVENNYNFVERKVSVGNCGERKSTSMPMADPKECVNIKFVT